ncbi:MAG: hypothetical protein QXT28_11715, partial [Thermofilaceae archaeon]
REAGAGPVPGGAGPSRPLIPRPQLGRRPLAAGVVPPGWAPAHRPGLIHPSPLRGGSHLRGGGKGLGKGRREKRVVFQAPGVSPVAGRCGGSPAL